MDYKYKIQKGESETVYIFRICQLKPAIGSWDDVADIINSELNLDQTSSSYRKPYQGFCNIFENVKHLLLDETYIEKLDERSDELYKQQVKTRDWLNEKRKTLRDEARIENLFDAFCEPIKALPKLEVSNYKSNGSLEAVLNLSDWHFGDVINNFYNTFNQKVFFERVEQLLSETIRYCKNNDVGKLYVLNLSDLINSNIHVSNRVSADIDVISQIKIVAETLSQFLNTLANQGFDVRYYSVLDNHSRLNKNYTEHIEKENLASLIDWFLEERLKDTKVSICHNTIDDNIGYIKLDNGKNLFFSHGHLDSINSVIQNYTLATGLIAHYVMIGHFHHKKSKEFQGCKLFVNGSLRGVDEYALSKRLFAKPSQTLLIFDGENEIDVSINLK